MLLVTTMPLAATAFALGGTRCGTKVCEAYQFCSKFHSECDECAPVCDQNNHNFDKDTCVSECRGKLAVVKLRMTVSCYAEMQHETYMFIVFLDYLYDSNFVKLSDYAGNCL